MKFKGLLKTSAPLPHMFIDRYPEDPTDLPEGVYESVYDSNDPAIKRFLNNIENVAKHIPLRTTSKLLKQPDSAHGNTDVFSAIAKLMNGNSHTDSTEREIPITYFNKSRQRAPREDLRRALTWGDGWWSPPQRRAIADAEWSPDDSPPSTVAYSNVASPQSTVAYSSPTDHSHDSQHGDLGISSSAFKPRPRMSHATDDKPSKHETANVKDWGGHAASSADGALPPPAHGHPADCHPGAPPADGPPGGPAAGDKDRRQSQDIEELAFQRLAVKAGGRKAAVKKPAKAAPVAKAAPANRRLREKQRPPGTAPKKRPAAAMGELLDLDYKVEWEHGDDTRCRNNFTSKHYDRAARRLQKHFRDAAAVAKKATLSEILHQASTLWCEHNK